MMRHRSLAIWLLAVCLFVCSACAPQTHGGTERSLLRAQEANAAEEAAPETNEESPVTDETAGKAPVIDEVTGKIRLTLAGIRLSELGWDYLTEQFNAQSEQYIVELRDYYAGDFDAGNWDKDMISRLQADIEDAKTRLHTDLIVGNMPDMLVFDGLSPLIYLGKGMLLDLDPYVAADADVSSEDFLCWNALHEYGGLYIMAKQFIVKTLACSQDFYAAHKGWTIADYLEIERSLRDNQQMIYAMSHEEFLTQMSGQYLAKALDMKNAACDFDNPEFVSILNGALSCGQYESPDYAGTPVPQRLEAGELMCCLTGLDHPSDVTFDRVRGGRQLSYIGWPTVDGSLGANAALYGDIGAFSSTACPEGCWEFIKFAVTREAVSTYEYYGSPVYAPLMREQVAKRNEDGGKYTTATEEDVAAYIAAAEACPAMAYRDESVMDIIERECAPMFAGDVTPEEAARNIQSRVSLYMVEQYS